MLRLFIDWSILMAPKLYKHSHLRKQREVGANKQEATLANRQTVCDGNRKGAQHTHLVLSTFTISLSLRVRTTIAVTEDGIFKIPSRKRFGKWCKGCFGILACVCSDQRWYLMLFANSTGAQESGARNGRVANLHFVAILRPDVAPLHPFGV